MTSLSIMSLLLLHKPYKHDLLECDGVIHIIENNI